MLLDLLCGLSFAVGPPDFHILDPSPYRFANDKPQTTNANGR